MCLLALLLEEVVHKEIAADGACRELPFSRWLVSIEFIDKIGWRMEVLFNYRRRERERV